MDNQTIASLGTININIGVDSQNRLLRPYYEYNIAYYYTSDTNFITPLDVLLPTISGGTYRKDANIFYFTPNNNNINDGTLILRAANTG